MISITKNQCTPIIIILTGLFLAGCKDSSFSPESTDQVSLSNGDTVEAKRKTVVVDTAKENPYLDLLLVVDDSSSMKADLLKLADKLSNFTGLLESSGFEWQMCLTTTQGYLSFGGNEFGRAVPWRLSNGRTQKVVGKGQGSLDGIFKRTIDAIPIGGSNSRNERGLRATTDHLERNPDCYRPGANFAVLLISDEDEASVGGNLTRVKNKEDSSHFFPLFAADQPEARLSSIMKKIGNVNFTFNSIIIKPDDAQCEINQSVESAAYTGLMYNTMSSLTGGGTGSICDSDYSKNLVLFKDKIKNTLKVINLDCVPYENRAIVTVNGGLITNYQLAETTLILDEPAIEGSIIDIQYQCLTQKVEAK
jgi:hypothetical protein